jgi:peptidoglycan/xylan/chitin deacetylase (PgdA/CDA1 family)
MSIVPKTIVADIGVPRSPQRTRWKPAPAIRLSLWFHIGGVLVALAYPGYWLSVAVALVGNHVILGLWGMWPKGQWVGANLVRLPEGAARRGQVALTFDDGPDVQVTPQVLDLLDRHGVKASFFCIAERAAAHPELVRDIVSRGHSVENHSHRHSKAFACYGLRALRREVETAQKVLGGITGRLPIFFRAPAGLRSPLLDPVMAWTGMRYISWTRRGYDAVRGDPVGVLHRLTQGLSAGDVLLLHDGSSARTLAGQPVVLAVLPELLDRLAARGLKGVSLPTAFDSAGLDDGFKL